MQDLITAEREIRIPLERYLCNERSAAELLPTLSISLTNQRLRTSVGPLLSDDEMRSKFT
jgi:hypothetical protein